MRPLIPQKSGIGGSQILDIKAIIHSFTSNSFSMLMTTTEAAILVEQGKPLVVDSIELPKALISVKC